MIKKFLSMLVLCVFSFNTMAETPVSATSTATSKAASSTGASGNASKLTGFKKFFDSPMGILTVSGIATVYSGILYGAADKQEKESQDNIKKIDKIIASFTDSYSGYCPKGRDNLAEPSCYCYTDAGKKNTNRTNSQACISLWAKNDYKLGGANGDYNAASFNGVAGCVALDGQFDETCKCKKFVDAKGVNACKKEASITLPNDAFSTGLATTGGLSDVLQFAANAGNGNPALDSLNSATLKTNAIKARQIKEALITKLSGVDKDMKIPIIDESNAAKFASAAIGDKVIAAGVASNSGMAMNVASARTDNPVVENLLKQAQEKVGIDVTGGKGIDAKKTVKRPGLDLNFSGDGAAPGGNGQVIADFPEEKKNYKYKNSDIVTDNSMSLFEIISNRYVQSGLKRLFDDAN